MRKYIIPLVFLISILSGCNQGLINNTESPISTDNLNTSANLSQKALGDGFTDILGDWNRVYEYSQGCNLDNSNPGYFEGDGSRVSNSTNSPQYFIYKNDSFSNLNIKAFYYKNNSPLVNIYSSDDGSSWDILEQHKSNERSTYSNSWFGVDIACVIPADSEFIKIEMLDNGYGGWGVQIGEVEFERHEICDPLIDMSLIYSYTSGCNLDTSNPHFFMGEGTRISNSTNNSQNIIYNLNNMGSYEIQTYYYVSKFNILKIYSSADGNTWNQINNSGTTPKLTYGVSWYRKDFNGELPSGTNYLKIEMLNNGFGGWAVQLGQINICESTDQTESNVLFDDFSYSSYNDSAINDHGWILRDGSGGPGISGAQWKSENITFHDDSLLQGNKIMRMESSTYGPNGVTTQTEIYTGKRKFLEGTYAARVKFTDTPFTGNIDGDHLVETFFTITPLVYNKDPEYSEIDFEYLANGGWGTTSSTMFMTTWETYGMNPWYSDTDSGRFSGSAAGWHTLLFTVKDGHVKYYWDGILKADHSSGSYPESPMSINFNLWFISGGLVDSPDFRSYMQEVDWVYHVKNKSMTQTEVEQKIAAFRNNGISYMDTIE